ncbi:DUF4097 domain-containing protein [Staphylococcus auricularis]|uniref:DUF4097 family beta strand repeat-containing protein n=1 Tax=Staphylococcus auricularis TaxID=29379 RepID=UPI001EF19A20|nr:DUF4097 family beta strand repeat-containing protein [Staphylococcus auricularis]MCG7342066.1 DUF4097 domain-containing protein [Staphylococcus auricularis]
MRKWFLIGLGIFLTCFILATIMWFGFEKQDNKANVVEKTYKDSKISQFNVDASTSEVKLHPGSKFKVYYKGKKAANVKKQDQTVKIEEDKEANDDYGLNFNPFRNSQNMIDITVPKQQIDVAKIKASGGRMDIEDIDIKKVVLSNEKEPGQWVTVKDSVIDQLRFNAKSTALSIDKSKIKDANIKSEQAPLDIADTVLQKAILINREEDINLERISGIKSIKGSTHQSSINVSFKNKPENMILKLNPVEGKSYVENEHFVNDKVGNGENELELYTEQGDIAIE